MRRLVGITSSSWHRMLNMWLFLHFAFWCNLFSNSPLGATRQETRIVCTLLWLHNNGELTKCIYYRIRPTSSSPLGYMDYPKYKPHIALRSIVSCIGAPSYKLSKYIASAISPLAEKTSSHILNSKHFVILYYTTKKIFSESVVLCHNAPDWSER